MARFQIRTHQQILADMIAGVVAKSQLSDVGDSAMVKHLLSASAMSDAELYYAASLILTEFNIDTATGEALDERAADIQPAVITRLEAAKATGNVVFSKATALGGGETVDIPAGTKVKTAGGIIFVTTTAAQLTSTSPEIISGHGVGRDVESGVAAESPGADGKVAADTIVKFVTKVTNIDEVTNPAATLHGRDEESDDSFRARIKSYVASLARCTVGALEVAVLGASDPDTGATILFTKVIEDSVNRGLVTLYIDDGTGTAEDFQTISAPENVTAGLLGPPADSAVGGEEVLYLDNWPIVDGTLALSSSTRGALVENTDYTLNLANAQLVFDPPLVAAEVITASTYDYYTGLIALAQKIIDGDPTDRENYPGHRAAGVLVRALVPQVLVQNVVCNLFIEEGYDRDEAVADVETAVKDYINGLSISGDVVRNELIKRVMQVSGVINVTLTTPAADVIILDNQLVRIQDANLTVT